MNRQQANSSPNRATPSVERGEMLAALSDAVVSIHKQFYGKGPETARAHLHRDLVVVLLQGGFTRGEHTLSERGRVQEVVQSRLAMQSSVEAEFRSAVETIVARPVRSFMSANDPENDLQVEIFVLLASDTNTSGDTREGDAASAARAGANEELAGRAERAREQHRTLLDEHRALRSEQEQSRRAIHRDRGQRER
jgi:uncharacterized protein YbcI